jgi:hypothetical protein
MIRASCRLALSLLEISLCCAAARPAPVEKKRRNPEVLAPVEFQADTARVCVLGYMIIEEKGETLIGLIKNGPAGKEIHFVKKDDIPKIAAPEFARDVMPLPVAVVTASFPFRKQVEACQEALNLRTVAALRDEPGAFPSFNGLHVERREVGPKTTDWEPLDLESPKSAFVLVLESTLKETAPEQAGLKAAQVAGLTLPLPVLEHGTYPECKLPLLRKTIADPQARVLPDYCLLRFPDFSIEPGKSYEYRVRVRMANPNFGKKARVEKEAFAEPKELLGPWARVPGKVALDPEQHYYVVDAKALDPKFPGRAAGPDEVALQIHRWVAVAEVTPPGPEDIRFYPVGCWLVAERFLVSRGAHVGGRHSIRLPVWSPDQRQYIEEERGGAAGVPVDFSPNKRLDEAPLLVDFEGGKRSYRGMQVEAPVEVLMLSHDGKLLGHDSGRDVADPVRREREGRWHEWLKTGKPPQWGVAKFSGGDGGN